MKRYIKAIQNADETDTIQRIAVNDSVELYRLDDGTDRVVAEHEGENMPLGVKDRYVSRKKGRVAPVVVHPTETGIQVQNRGSTNPIEVIKDNKTEYLEEEHDPIEVTQDCVIKLGNHTRIRANVRGAQEAVDQPSEIAGEDTLRQDAKGQANDHPAQQATVQESTSSAVSGGSSQDSNNITLYVHSMADKIEHSIELNNVARCRDYLKELRDTLIEIPVDHPSYESTTNDVKAKIDQLNTKLGDRTMDAEFDQQKQREIESILHSVRTMYAKK
jgi:hypothetical protein